MAENPILAAQIYNTVAENTGVFWTFTEFQRLQNNSPEKPIEPDPEDPKLWPNSTAHYPSELVAKLGVNQARKFIAAKNLADAQDAYEREFNTYQKLQAQIRTIRASSDFTETGYIKAFCDVLAVNFPKFVREFFFEPRPFKTDEKKRQRHTFVSAATGSGKSESFKHLIRHYLLHAPDSAVVILDPHGDLAEDIARFRELKDRLVYINPVLFKGRRIAFNPLDVTTNENNERKLNSAQTRYLSSLEIILGERFSPAQKSLLKACLGVLLHKESATLDQLIDFMDDTKNSELIAYGIANLPNQKDRDFLEKQFYNKKTYETTRVCGHLS